MLDVMQGIQPRMQYVRVPDLRRSTQKMKPLARVAIPESTPPEVEEDIKDCLSKSYSHIEFEYETKFGIDHPIALSLKTQRR